MTLLLSDSQPLSQLLQMQGVEHQVISKVITSFSKCNGDLIIYDSTFNGIEPLLTANEVCKIVILGSLKDKPLVDAVIDRNGMAFLVIDDFLDEIEMAIATVTNNKTYVTSKLIAEKSSPDK